MGGVGLTYYKELGWSHIWVE